MSLGLGVARVGGGTAATAAQSRAGRSEALRRGTPDPIVFDQEQTALADPPRRGPGAPERCQTPRREHLMTEVLRVRAAALITRPARATVSILSGPCPVSFPPRPSPPPRFSASPPACGRSFRSRVRLDDARPAARAPDAARSRSPRRSWSATSCRRPRAGSLPSPSPSRIVAGGLGAAWLTRSRRRAPLVLAGAAGALAGAVLGFRARTRLPSLTRTSDLPWAVLEDLSAAALARTAVRLASG